MGRSPSTTLFQFATRREIADCIQSQTDSSVLFIILTSPYRREIGLMTIVDIGTISRGKCYDKNADMPMFVQVSSPCNVYCDPLI